LLKLCTAIANLEIWSQDKDEKINVECCYNLTQNRYTNMDVTERTHESNSLWFRLVFGANPAITLIRAAVLFGVSMFLFTVVVIPIRVQGISMLPNFRDNSIHFVLKIAYLKNRPQRGDIVAVKFIGNKIALLKRVIGLPGEKLSIKDGIVYINGEPLEEPYVKFKRARWNFPETVLRSDEYFLIGDNRSMAMEAHSFGAVNFSRIIGKLLL